MIRTILVASAALLLAPFAEAQSYRCIGKDGKRYYGQVVPAECSGQSVELLSPQGLVVKRIDPEGGAKERLAKEAAEARKREEEAAAREARRRNRALLATYTSEKDIDEARERALEENKKTILEIEERIAEIRKRQTEYEKELESYAAKNPPPAKLTVDIRGTENDLKVQQDLLDVKTHEVSGINARYDEDKKRYAELAKSR